jgi:hypothetical protein
MLMVLALHASLVTPCGFTGDALLARLTPERGRSATLLVSRTDLQDGIECGSGLRAEWILAFKNSSRPLLQLHFACSRLSN